MTILSFMQCDILCFLVYESGHQWRELAIGINSDGKYTEDFIVDLVKKRVNI